MNAGSIALDCGPVLEVNERCLDTVTAEDKRRHQKEKEKSELIRMILESIANVPVAVEKIHTNPKLRAAIREEIGEESKFLYRFFQPTNSTRLDSQCFPTDSTIDMNWDQGFAMDINDDIESNGDGDTASKSRSDVDNAECGFALQNTRSATAFTTSPNEICRTKRYAECDIASELESEIDHAFCTSSSPESESFINLDMSVLAYSHDGEPVSALWPRQPNEFAFTQEEESNMKVGDEVYNELADTDDELLVPPRDSIDIERSVAAHEIMMHKVQDLSIKKSANSQNGEDDMHGVEAPRAAGNDKSVTNVMHDKYDTIMLRVVCLKKQTGFEPSEDWKPEMHSVIAGRYQVESAIGEAVFSRTYRCLDMHNNEQVCLKIIRNAKDFFDQGIDEIRILEYIRKNCDVKANNLLRLIDYLYFHEHLILVTELLCDNLYEFSNSLRNEGFRNYFSIPRIKYISKQLLQALECIHSLDIVHCDLKPENVLFQDYLKHQIKIVDFGSACFVSDELTSYVQSRSYRAPEVILGAKYDCKVDIWSLGCILVELYLDEVLFSNDSERSMIASIVRIIGPIPATYFDKNRDLTAEFETNDVFKFDQDGNAILKNSHGNSTFEKLIKTKDVEFVKFLRGLLQIDPELRFSASQALRHSCFNLSAST